MKYKKCHGREGSGGVPFTVEPLTITQTSGALLSPKALAELGEKVRAKAMKTARFGRTRLPNSTLFQGKRMIGVGNKIYGTDPMRHPCDFMNDLIMDLLGREWGNAELEKPLEERHPILKWFNAVGEFNKEHPRNEQGMYGGVMTGPVASWFRLAYELWVLSHHAAIRDELIERLKRPESYQSARYEITVAALFIRAGFDLEHEKEDDNTRKHPEFIATHIETKERVAVEAKSRHRVGVLGFGGVGAEPAANIRAGLSGLVRGALGKKPGLPFVVCVDLNAPPIEAPPHENPVFNDAAADLKAIEFEHEQARQHPATNLIVITNYPHHYGDAHQPDPRRDTFITTYHTPLYPFENPATHDAIMMGLQTYSQIPTRWEDFD